MKASRIYSSTSKFRKELQGISDRTERILDKYRDAKEQNIKDFQL